MSVYHHWTDEEIEFLRNAPKDQTRGSLRKKFIAVFGEITDHQLSRALRQHDITGFNLPAAERRLLYAAHRPVGSEVLRQYGGRSHVNVKVAEPNVWKRKHTVLWEAEHGPVPEGCVLFNISGDPYCGIDQLLLVKKSDTAILCHCFGVHRGMDAEAFQTALTALELKKLIKKLKNSGAPRRQPGRVKKHGSGSGDAAGKESQMNEGADNR